MDKETQRRMIEAKLSLAMDVIEKALTLVSIEWNETAAHASLAYIQEAANTGAQLLSESDINSALLIQEYLREENDGTRPVGNLA